MRAKRRLSPRYSPKALSGPRGTCGLVRALGAGVEEGDDDVGLARRRSGSALARRRSRPSSCSSEYVEKPTKATLRALLGERVDLAGRAGDADLGALERVTRGAPADRAVVEGVVVGVVDHVDARPSAASWRCPAGAWKAKQFSLPAAALGRAAGAEGALVVERRDVGLAQRRADGGEQRAPGVGRVAVGGAERDVAAPGDEQAFALAASASARRASAAPRLARLRSRRTRRRRRAPPRRRCGSSLRGASPRDSRRCAQGSSYQAWAEPQCGQPTEVVTAALKT